uniref:Ig-like domain-containing protein n=1 Tax=Sinocyclocheilus rhinocerous TaxID=307959 RepID=A0A673NHL4_9TELE
MKTFIFWFSLFTGDSVTLRCEVDQSQDGWEFLWSKNSNTESTEAATKTINSVKVSDGGEYRCRIQSLSDVTYMVRDSQVGVFSVNYRNTHSVLLLSLTQVNTPVMEQREEDHATHTAVMQLH